jgi:DNA-binding MarR family transcriptional regulator
MTHSESNNVIGAMALALSDAVRVKTRGEAPKNITAAGLTLIGHVPGLSIQELSMGLELSHPGAVRLVDRMVASGLVTRTRSRGDNRTVELTLTVSGKSKEEAILASRSRSLDQALSHLSIDEIASLSQISRKLLRAIVGDEETAWRVCRLCNSAECIGCPVEAALDNGP